MFFVALSLSLSLSNTHTHTYTQASKYTAPRSCSFIHVGAMTRCYNYKARLLLTGSKAPSHLLLSPPAPPRNWKNEERVEQDEQERSRGSRGRRGRKKKTDYFEGNQKKNEESKRKSNYNSARKTHSKDESEGKAKRNRIGPKRRSAPRAGPPPFD